MLRFTAYPMTMTGRAYALELAGDEINCLAIHFLGPLVVDSNKLAAVHVGSSTRSCPLLPGVGDATQCSFEVLYSSEGSPSPES